MKRFGLHAVLVSALLLVLGVGSYALAGGGSKELRAQLTGLQEAPVVFSDGSGSFRATLDPNANTIGYTLTYAGLETDATQSHIHIAQRNVSGGITLFLCTNLGNAPAGTTVPPCPAAGGTVTGVLGPGDIAGPAAQGITGSGNDQVEWDQLESLIRAGLTYANVHSVSSPPGEIRGQIRRGGGED